MERSTAAAVLAALAISSWTSALAAQDPEATSAIAGIVLEADSDRRVSGVALRLRGTGLQTLSGADGTFSFRGLPPGHYELAAEHMAYRSAWTVLEVPLAGTVHVEVLLSVDPIAVEPITVTAVRDHRLDRRGFYERREWGEKLGLGEFFGPEELEAWPFVRVSDVVTRVPGLKKERVCSDYGCYELFFARGVAPRMSPRILLERDVSHASQVMSLCPMKVYVNGIDARLFRLASDGGFTVLDGVDHLVHSSEVAAIEVYRRVSELPAEFSGTDSRCGVVAIWTK